MSSSPSPIKFVYHFHPVGQGLFASGFLNPQYDGPPSFMWVYDCGSTSKKCYLNREIGYLEHFTSTKKRIDLLVLSHFDQDHINGVVELIKQFEIGTVILPYMPLEDRIMLACRDEQANSSSTLDNFYINPAKFLFNIESSNIDTIIFVPKSDGQSLEPENIKEGNQLHYEKDNINGDEDKELLHSTSDSNNVSKVNFLMPGSSITVIGQQWEFVPYNDPSYKRYVDEPFTDLIKKEKKKLLDPDQAKGSLSRIKSAYAKQFKSGNQNSISLFLYSGPIYQKEKYCYRFYDRENLIKLEAKLCRWFFHDLLHHSSKYKKLINQSSCSILYTGDGSLNGLTP